jgi:RNA polymerase sigma-70 factor, ECF subfamily
MFDFLSRSATWRLDDFSALLQRRSARWYSACLRITKDPHLAEDAVQDALLKAWDKRAQFRAEAELDTWIHRIAINCALDLLRRVRPLSLDSDEAAVGDSPAALFADSSLERTPTQYLHTQQLGEQLQQALAHLTDLERLCFVLKHLEEYRLEEIADELHCSIDRVKQALFRGVRKLRLRLKSFGATP